LLYATFAAAAAVWLWIDVIQALRPIANSNNSWLNLDDGEAICGSTSVAQDCAEGMWRYAYKSVSLWAGMSASSVMWAETMMRATRAPNYRIERTRER
jgi:hypothetical protein